MHVEHSHPRLPVDTCTLCIPSTPAISFAPHYNPRHSCTGVCVFAALLGAAESFAAEYTRVVLLKALLLKDSGVIAEHQTTSP